MPRRQGQRLKDADRARLQDDFIKAFLETANFTEACKRADNVARKTVYAWLNEDPDFKARYEDAVEAANDALRAEMWRRGVTGWDATETTEEIDEAGMVVSRKVKTVRQYDSGLLRFMAQARMPEYKQRVDVTSDGKAVGSGYETIAGIIDDPDRAADACRLIEKLAGYRQHASGSSVDIERS